MRVRTNTLIETANAHTHTIADRELFLYARGYQPGFLFVFLFCFLRISVADPQNLSQKIDVSILRLYRTHALHDFVDIAARTLYAHTIAPRTHELNPWLLRIHPSPPPLPPYPITWVSAQLVFRVRIRKATTPVLEILISRLANYPGRASEREPDLNAEAHPAPTLTSAASPGSRSIEQSRHFWKRNLAVATECSDGTAPVLVPTGIPAS